ncbi:MAG: deoxyribodipyrimidine photo-lyase [Kangiellaceae bacterium]|jgi:deoxyribodipyrimidine photo-lyase|nr:deoxyribodipyrimidine photo-lyase [Kangiellaceae bacterium]
MSVLIWFRNDLRLDDNPALSHALKQCLTEQRDLTALFVETPMQWRSHDLAPIKADFIERHLNLLSNALAGYGINLEFMSAKRFDDQIDCVLQYCQRNNIVDIYVNDEIEVNEIDRDSSIKLRAEDANINFHHYQADTIIEKKNVLNKQGEMFKVFTPYKRAWLNTYHSNRSQLSPINTISALSDYAANQSQSLSSVETKIHLDYPKVDSSKWPLSDEYLSKVLPSFIANKVSKYNEQRDFPAIKATSGISPYLASGLISSKRALDSLLANYPDILDDPKHPSFTWVNELIWREFYRDLIIHFPDLCKHRNFNSKYDNLAWLNSSKFIEAWQHGKTGYPIVDAAMRQLNQTGWMHNRLRMIVASFLTKHLLVDWRIGEKYFMQTLIDGDLAANNGGWQWSAGTGCDAQPYFRIFNPITQSKKFDPEGAFIRKYLPELIDIPDKYIHLPHDYISQNNLAVYWPPIVDHATARQTALDFYKEHL